MTTELLLLNRCMFRSTVRKVSSKIATGSDEATILFFKSVRIDEKVSGNATRVGNIKLHFLNHDRLQSTVTKILGIPNSNCYFQKVLHSSEGSLEVIHMLGLLKYSY